MTWPEKIDIPGRVERGREEGQAADMVPVIMSQHNEHIALVRLLQEPVAKRDYAGARVTHEQMAVNADLHA